MRVTPPPAYKSASSDEWQSVIQVVIEVGSLAAIGAREVLIGIVSDWLYDKLKGLRDDGRRGTTIDQSVHNDVRVFIDRIEINGLDRTVIEGAVRDAIESATPSIEIPPQLTVTRHSRRALTDEEWVAAQIEMGRRHQVEMERLMERTRRRKRRKRPPPAA